MVFPSRVRVKSMLHLLRQVIIQDFFCATKPYKRFVRRITAPNSFLFPLLLHTISTMSSHSSLVITTLLFSLLIACVSAQVGPSIKTPEYNSTVTPGDHITIEYEYQNMGTGNYTLGKSLHEKNENSISN